MDILLWIVPGVAAGLVARLVMRDAPGVVTTMVLGIAGALLAGWLGRVVGLYPPGEPAGLIMATMGAVIVLVYHRVIADRSL